MFNLPNLLTLINLFFGTCAILAFQTGQFIIGIKFIACSGVADFLDGMIARLMKISSPLGKELDSLADMVSFGVVPGVILYKLLEVHFPYAPHWGVNMYAAPAFLVTAFACLRLAKFNLDERQSEGFIGLNTPAMTIFVIGILLIIQNDSLGLGSFINNPIFLFSIVVVLSYLLIAEISFFSFKMKSLAWKGNETRYIFLGIALLEILLLREAAPAPIILTYLLVSLFAKK